MDLEEKIADLDEVGISLEEVEVAYLDLLKEWMPAALVKVERKYQRQGDHLVLPKIEFWHGGNIPDDSLFDVVSKFPALTVEAINLTGTPEGSTGIGVVNPVLVRVYTTDKATAKSNTLTHRYGEAALMVVTQKKPLRIKAREEVELNVAQTVGIEDGPFLKGVRLIVPVQIGAKL